MAESLGLGYLVTGIIVCAAIVATMIAWRFGLDAVLSFWIAYILTRPLGASLGDYLSQAQANGGLGLGASSTTAVFIIAILVVVTFLTITKRDLIASPSTVIEPGEKSLSVVRQVIVVMAVILIAAGSGYSWRHTQIRNQALAEASPVSSPWGTCLLSGALRKIPWRFWYAPAICLPHAYALVIWSLPGITPKRG